MTTVASPTSATTSRIATLRMPSSSVAPVPVASRVDGTPKSISPPTPACTASTAALRSESRECCTTPGIEAIGARLGQPFPDEQRQHQVGRRRPGLRDQRPHRGRACAAAAAGRPGRGQRWIPLHDRPQVALRRAVARFCDGRSTGSPAATAAARTRRAVLRQRRGQVGHRRRRREDVDPQAVLLRRLRGGRADARDHRGRVRLARDADQVAHRRGRREDDRVVAAALDGLADRCGRRRGAHGPVGRDVVDLPAALDQAGHQVLGGDVGPRQEDPVDRVEDRVVGRPVLEQAGGRLLAAGHQVGLDAPREQVRSGLLADGRHLDAGERAGVQAVLLEPLADGLDGVARGERDPLVASGRPGP